MQDTGLITITILPDEIDETVQATHEEFLIICGKCGCKNVCIESNIGWSELSGSWGSVDLKCVNCKNYTEIYEP